MKTPAPILYIGCALLGFSLGTLDRFAFPHYRVYVHDLGTSGAHMPVFLKFDNREGRSWKSRGLDEQWHEMTEGAPFPAGAAPAPTGVQTSGK